MKNRLVDTVGKGEDGMNGDSSIEVCILPRVKWNLLTISQTDFAVRCMELGLDVL